MGWGELHASFSLLKIKYFRVYRKLHVSQPEVFLWTLSWGSRLPSHCFYSRHQELLKTWSLGDGAGASASRASPFCLFQEKNKTNNRKPNQTTTLVRHPREVFVSRVAWLNCVGCSSNSQHPTGEMTEHMGGGGEKRRETFFIFCIFLCTPTASLPPCLIPRATISYANTPSPTFFHILAWLLCICSRSFAPHAAATSLLFSPCHTPRHKWSSLLHFLIFMHMEPFYP